MVSDLPAKPDKQDIEPYRPGDLLIEVVDEQALHQARERHVARLRLLWHKRRFLLWATLCGFVLGAIIALLIPKSYRSTAALMPPDQGWTAGTLMGALSGGGSGGGILGNVGDSLANMAQSGLGVRTNGDLFIGILQSETVQHDLIRKFNLKTVYGTRYIADTRKALAGHSDISADSKSGIISITVTDHSPERAAAMAQEYIQELNWVVTHLSTSSAHREREFLDGRLKQVKADLDTAEKQFSQFASQKGAIDIPEQGKAMVTAAATLQGQLIATEAELKALRAIYTDNNVRVRSLQAQVNELRQQLEKIGGKDVSEESSAQELYPSLRELPLLGVTYADLLRRTKVEEAVFAVLTQEYEMAKLHEVKDTPSVKVLDPPSVPDHQSFPSLPLAMVTGAALGLVLGCAWSLGVSAWQAVDTEDPRKMMAVQVWRDMRSSLSWIMRNGSSNRGLRRWFRNRFHRSEGGEVRE